LSTAALVNIKLAGVQQDPGVRLWKDGWLRRIAVEISRMPVCWECLSGGRLGVCNADDRTSRCTAPHQLQAVGAVGVVFDVCT
jgi:hypothetical protein